MTMSIIRKGAILAACLTALGTWTVAAEAASQSIKVALSRTQQVPPVQTTATERPTSPRSGDTRTDLEPQHSGLSGPATMVHFHGPADAGKNSPPVMAQPRAVRSGAGKGQATDPGGRSGFPPASGTSTSTRRIIWPAKSAPGDAAEELIAAAVGTRRPQRQRCGRREGSVHFARSAARISLRPSGW
jgi:hypothetical protein